MTRIAASRTTADVSSSTMPPIAAVACAEADAQNTSDHATTSATAMRNRRGMNLASVALILTPNARLSQPSVSYLLSLSPAGTVGYQAIADDRPSRSTMWTS